MVEFPTSLFFEFIALVSSVIFFLRKRDKLIYRFMLFLLVTVAVESAGWIWTFSRYSPPLQAKWLMYNIFFIIEFVFYGYIFYLNFQKKLFRQITLLSIFTIVSFAVLNMVFLQGFNKTINYYTSLLGSFFIVLFCCFFFYESIQPEHIDKQLAKQPLFWISSGLLIFYLGSVIINALYDYLRRNELQDQGRRIYYIILHFLNVILYCSFCIAFYVCPDRRKTYSSQSS